MLTPYKTATPPRGRFIIRLLLFVTALSLRWGFALRYPPGVQLHDVDARGYHLLAVNLLEGHGFSLSSGPPYVPDAIRTPAYPLFIAALYTLGGRNPAQVSLAQGVLDALTTLLLASATARVTRQARLGWLAGGLYALNPTAWRFCNELLTEIPLACCLTLLGWTCVRSTGNGRRRWLFLGGGLAGLALLIKPNLILLPIVVSAAAAWPRPRLRFGSRLRRAAVVLAASGLVIFPWIVRNRIVFDRWFLSHAFESNLARVSAVAALVHAQGERVAPWTPRWEAIYSGILLRARERYGSAFQGAPATGPEVDVSQRQLAAVAGDIIREHPVDFVLAHVSGFARAWVPQEHRFWYGVLSGQAWESLGSQEGVLGQALDTARAEGWRAAFGFVWQARVASLPPLAVALWAGWLSAYALSAVLSARGLWHLRASPALVFLCLGIIVYTTFLPGPISYIRFRVPVAPLLTLLMVNGLGRDEVRRTNP